MSTEMTVEAWEAAMVQVQADAAVETALAEIAKKFSMDDRMRLAHMNPPQALPDGSYPIENKGDLSNAITLCQSGHGDVAAAKTLIKRMAKKLGAENMLPNDWKAM